jgi:hypothetical protein
MKQVKIVLSILFLFQLSLVWAGSSKDATKEIKSTPPRIIRACCAFGYDLNLVGLPFITITHISSVEQLGNHHYLGDNNEGNGLIYTQRGGFIDVGHLRDIADWTNYLYSIILMSRGEGRVVQKLGYEGGRKNLYFDLNADMDSSDCLILAGKIAFDLSLWHELSTWFGASTIPMMPERYSSFSVEDVYSNLLGVYIAMEALQSNLPYNQGMTELLAKTLADLAAVTTEEETYAALEAVRNIWWTRDKRLPNKNVILKRDTDVYTNVHPWLVPDTLGEILDPYILSVPKTTATGQDLASFYELTIDLNYKFPVTEIFPERSTREITQNDLEDLLNRVSQDLNIQEHSIETKSQLQTLQPSIDRNPL